MGRRWLRPNGRVEHRRGPLCGRNGCCRERGVGVVYGESAPGGRPPGRSTGATGTGDLTLHVPSYRLHRTDGAPSNAQFRQPLYKHYVATRDGKGPLPTLFRNTCFTRGGGRLNECNAANQTSLIKAALRSLDPKATYKLRSDATGADARAKGAELMGRFQLTIPERHRSDLLTYRRAEE